MQKKRQPENWKRQNSSSWFPHPTPPCWVELVLNLAAIHFLPSGINSCIQFKSWNQEYGTMPRFLFCFAETDFGDNGQSIAMEKGKVDAARAFNVFSWLQKLKRTTDPTQHGHNFHPTNRNIKLPFFLLMNQGIFWRLPLLWLLARRTAILASCAYHQLSPPPSWHRRLLQFIPNPSLPSNPPPNSEPDHISWWE